MAKYADTSASTAAPPPAASEQVERPPGRPKWKWLLVVLAVALLAVRSGHIYMAEVRQFHRQRHIVERPERPLSAFRDVTFEASPGGPRLAGWYADSQNGSALVLTHGMAGDRTNLLAEARKLQEGGFGVLLFDWPGHGESEGEIQWAQSERHALEGALGFVLEQPGMEDGNLGFLGFSAGALIAVQVAAIDPRVKAMALLGAPTNLRVWMEYHYPRLASLGLGPLLLSQHPPGFQEDALATEMALPYFAPRPVLLVSGELDHDVPPSMSAELLDLAGPRAELLIVEGAHHGDYARAEDGDLYMRKLLAFFERELVARPLGREPINL